MGRYRNVHCLIWYDEKFVSLSDDAKLIWFFFLTNPRGTMLGIAVQGQSDMAEFLGWPMKRFAKPFQELLTKQFIAYDDPTRTLYLRNFLKYNPIENENQAKSAAKLLDEIPEASPFIQDVQRFLERLGKPFLKPLLERLVERYAQPGAVAVSSIQEQDSPSSPPEGDRPWGDRDFESWWDILPDAMAKAKIKAREAWDRKVKHKQLPEVAILIGAIQAQKASRRWREGIIPNATTWLNGGRWMDRVECRDPPSAMSQALETWAQANQEDGG